MLNQSGSDIASKANTAYTEEKQPLFPIIAFSCNPIKLFGQKLHGEMADFIRNLHDKLRSMFLYTNHTKMFG